MAPIKASLEKLLEDFERALIERGVYDQGYENLKRAMRGAKDFVKFLTEGPKGLISRR